MVGVDLPRRLPERLPTVGELVHVRSRQWLVERVEPPAQEGDTALVHLACADDDAQGQQLAVYWSYEPDRLIIEDEGWDDLASRGFDDPRQFGAFLHTLRWGCVTATDPTLFQAPYRAGIKIDAYQMEPLRKALRLPRVNLFIADDTGLGKTIEAGLIARELLLRKKVRTIVVAAPPAVLGQWQAELEERFGLVFVVLDRAYLTQVRRERGFGVNPWRTHSRFLVSHHLLTDPTYTAPLHEWLGEFRSGSLLVLDEAHHAAPSSGGRYGIETHFTRAIRDLSRRFEHRLFLSATPHNGHSNSFSTLLELLDPTRFTRGVPVRKAALKDIMVRRLKEDVRELQGGFPKRVVSRLLLDGLPDDAPELELSWLLDAYRELREQRFAGTSKRAQATAKLLVVGLQQRLLSSVEAFARSLDVHRKTVQRHWEQGVGRPVAEPESSGAPAKVQARLLLEPLSADAGEVDDEALGAQDDEAVQAVSDAAEAEAPRDGSAAALWAREQELLERMGRVAAAARGEPDAKLRALVDWIRAHQCPDLPELGESVSGSPPRWTDRRVLIFTENRQGTKRYLREQLEQAIAGTDRDEERIEVIDGLTSSTRRREIQARFNKDPAQEPLRILLATDAAREGLNFQAHCTDLFHWDLPWNPGRIEQRNGRIDRKLQPADEVRCHYFVLPQRVEDRVLEVLVRKTETIRRELGSLAQVIDDDIEARLKRGGIRHAEAAALADELEAAELEAEQRRASDEELGAARERQDDLRAQMDTCRSLLKKAADSVGFHAEPFREALSCSLELLGAEPLRREDDEAGQERWSFPRLDAQAGADPSWAATLDTLRTPRERDQKLAAWRREAPIRPVVFKDTGTLSDDTVHLHLEQRVAQRLLARFRAQGFLLHDLSRACLSQVADAIPRVVLLGRLSLYGRGAERLHEELVPLAARWIDPARRDEALKPYAAEAESKTLALLEESLRRTSDTGPDPVVERQLLDSAARDVAELLPHLEPRAHELADRAIEKLAQRGAREARELEQTLVDQRKRVQERLAKHDKDSGQGRLAFNPAELRQVEEDARAWRRRLEEFERELADEPARLQAFYEVRARRVEPVGLVYLWPESN